MLELVKNVMTLLKFKVVIFFLAIKQFFTWLLFPCWNGLWGLGSGQVWFTRGIIDRFFLRVIFHLFLILLLWTFLQFRNNFILHLSLLHFRRLHPCRLTLHPLRPLLTINQILRLLLQLFFSILQTILRNNIITLFRLLEKMFWYLFWHLFWLDSFGVDVSDYGRFWSFYSLWLVGLGSCSGGFWLLLRFVHCLACLLLLRCLFLVVLVKASGFLEFLVWAWLLAFALPLLFFFDINLITCIRTLFSCRNHPFFVKNFHLRS